VAMRKMCLDPGTNEILFGQGVVVRRLKSYETTEGLIPMGVIEYD
jgi:hypothetical protein